MRQWLFASTWLFAIQMWLVVGCVRHNQGNTPPVQQNARMQGTRDSAAPVQSRVQSDAAAHCEIVSRQLSLLAKHLLDNSTLEEEIRNVTHSGADRETREMRMHVDDTLFRVNLLIIAEIEKVAIDSDRLHGIVTTHRDDGSFGPLKTVKP
jgi:hypothetical protein